jgi:hypothetical protein
LTKSHFKQITLQADHPLTKSHFKQITLQADHPLTNSITLQTNPPLTKSRFKQITLSPTRSLFDQLNPPFTNSIPLSPTQLNCYLAGSKLSASGQQRTIRNICNHKLSFDTSSLQIAKSLLVTKPNKPLKGDCSCILS